MGLRWYLAAFFIPLGGALLAVRLSAAPGLLQKVLPNWWAIAGPLSLAIFGLTPLGFVLTIHILVGAAAVVLGGAGWFWRKRIRVE